MRILLVASLLAVPFFANAQDHNTYGLTDSQIAEMGETRWDQFYAGKAGESTAAMVEMNDIYGEALRRRNDLLEASAKQEVKARVDKLRALLVDIGGTACDIGYNIDGGGTIWSPVTAHVEATTEQVLYEMLGGRAMPATHLTTSAVEKQLDVLAKKIAKTHADKDAAAYFKYEAAKASLDKMRTDFAEIKNVAKALDRPKSDRVLGCCKDYAKMALGDWS